MSRTSMLQKMFADAFATWYDRETADSLGELHAVYHARFVDQLLRGPGANVGEASAIATQANRIRKAIRILPPDEARAPSAGSEALMDEIYEMILSAGSMTANEVQSSALALGDSPESIRVSLERLVEHGKLVRTQQGKEPAVYQVKDDD